MPLKMAYIEGAPGIEGRILILRYQMQRLQQPELPLSTYVPCINEKQGTLKWEMLFVNFIQTSLAW